MEKTQLSGTTQKQTRPQTEGASSVAGSDKRRPVTSTGSASDDPHNIGNELRQLVRDKTYEQIDSQKERATGTLGAVAGAVRHATDTLREGGQTGLAGYVSRAADEIDRWAARLRDQDLDDAVREVQAFARRKPAIFLGMAFGAGVLAARFFKSSVPVTSAGNRPSSQWMPGASSGYREQPSVAHDVPDSRHDLSASREEFS